MTDSPSLRPIGNTSFMKPPQKRFIAVSFLVAFMLDLIPLSDALIPYRVDFVALVLLYWCTFAPNRVGLLIAFLMGVLVDVANASLFGQHACNYVLIAFGALLLRHRMLSFPLWQQTLFVALICEACIALTFIIRALVGNDIAVSPAYLIVPAVAALILWAPISFILQYPQRKAASPAA
ncbi:MAG: rod shape-determining protein MreD [Burkholderiales bacterium]|jgi:rod shape-determining protein MreD|nr:rod shape-determining protein MreD [Burkholderiales bacterium]